MWKDFFYFNKGERRALVALTLLILFLQVALWTTDSWLPLLPERLTGYAANQKALKAFQDSTLRKESRGAFSYGSSATYSGRSSASRVIRPTIFDPNTADSARLVSLGLRPYVARNILKYRRKGGVFRKPEDFARIYGIKPEQYARLKPYLRLGANMGIDVEKKGGAAFSSLSENNPYTGSAKMKPDRISVLGEQPASVVERSTSSPGRTVGSLTLEVNRADTSVLQQLKGVGAKTANRIAQYRDRLGGFYSVRQLEEIKGIYPDALSRLQSLLKVDTTQISKINANKASLERLRSHPYLNFYQARVIVELRKARSGIRKIGDLADFREFTKADLDRLRWYLVF